jgi:hypothetical protein
MSNCYGDTWKEKAIEARDSLRELQDFLQGELGMFAYAQAADRYLSAAADMLHALVEVAKLRDERGEDWWRTTEESNPFLDVILGALRLRR